MNNNKPFFFQTRAGFIAITLLYLAGSFVSATEAANIESVTPAVVDFGRRTKIKIKVSGWDKNRRLVIKPGGLGAISPKTSAPQISREGVSQGGSRRATIRDNILYVADWFSGLHIYDISDPRKLRHISNFHTQGSSKGVVLKGDYAFVGDDDHGLQILNVSDPANPRKISEVASTGLAYTMKIVGDILYLADHRGGFHIIDISDVKSPKTIGGFDTPGKSWGIDVKDNFAFVADDSSGLLVFDVSNPKSPKLAGKFNPGGEAEDVVIAGDRAFITFFDLGLYIVDISDPRRPVEVGHTKIPGNARGISIDGSYAYVAGFDSGLIVVDIADMTSPEIVGQYDTRGSAWGVNVKDGFAYVLDWWGGVISLDISEPSHPLFVDRYHARGTIERLAASGNFIYTASATGGVQVFDINNPLNPIWSTGVDVPDAQDIWVDGNRVYVAAGKGGVQIIDITDPFYSKLLGSMDTPGDAYIVRARGSHAYIADRNAGLIVADVRDPLHMNELKRYRYDINDLSVDDHALYIADDSGLTVLNTTDPLKLAPTATYRTKGEAKLVRVAGGMVALYETGASVRLLRHGADGFKLVSLFNPHDEVADMRFGGSTLYIVGKRRGLMVVDISSPETPRLKTIYPATGRLTALAISSSGAAFFAGEETVASVELLPDITFKYDGNGELTAVIPANMPTGSYDMLTVDSDGAKDIKQDAIIVRLKKRGKSKFTVERFKQILKQRRAEGSERNLLLFK